jgi:hypothetical protein
MLAIISTREKGLNNEMNNIKKEEYGAEIHPSLPTPPPPRPLPTLSVIPFKSITKMAVDEDFGFFIAFFVSFHQRCPMARG